MSARSEGCLHFVARGFIPARLRSSRSQIYAVFQKNLCAWLLGLLRSPAGINPLATGLCS
ncbi:protein of unknown function [Pseudomonas mediterranea]